MARIKVEGSLAPFRKQLKDILTREVGKHKKKATEQALDAIVTLLPVWSGATQDSILVSEGQRRTSGKLGYKRRQDAPNAGRHFGETSKMPLGQGQEPRSNPGKVKGQIRNVRENSLESVYITANSTASDAGLWEGQAPSPDKARNPRNTLGIIISRTKVGTAFS